MGFFSWNCNSCGHPLLSHYVLEDRNAWMSNGVAILEDGSVLRGEYDGYGRLNDHEINDFGSPECYHEACWNLEGKPTEYNQPSEDARDQGYFFDDNVHNFPEPKNQEDLRTLKTAGDLAQQAACDAWKSAHCEYLIGKAYDAIAKIEDRDEEMQGVFDDLKRHVDKEQKNRDTKEAMRLGLEYADYLKLKEGFKKVGSERSDSRRFEKAEKVGDFTFRLTNDQELCFDQDFENDKVYMVHDPYGEIKKGTEREDWAYHTESV